VYSELVSSPSLNDKAVLPQSFQKKKKLAKGS